MGCYIDQIVKNLGSQSFTETMLNNPNNIIRNVRLFCETTIMEAETLYVGMGSRLKQTDFHDRNISILLLGSGYNKAELRGTKQLNLLQMETEKSLEEVFNEILMLFQRYSLPESNSDKEIMQKVFSGRGIQSILNIGWGMLSNPVFLLTETGELVAKSADMRVPDQICEELQKTGTISDKTLAFLMDDSRKKRLQLLSEPLLVQRDYLLYDRILSSLKLGAAQKGVIVVLEVNHPFRKEDYEIIKMLSHAVEQEIKSSESMEEVNTVKKETLIADLLDGIIMTPDHLQARLDRCHWKLPHSFRMLLITITISSDAYLSFYKILFHHAFPGADVCIYKEALAIFLPDKEILKNEDKTKIRLEELLEETGLRCVISRELHSLLELKKAFEQAQNISKIVFQEKPDFLVLEEDNFLLYAMLSELERRQNLTEYCHPILFKIHEYDQKNNSEYEKTLYTYLKNGKELVRTFNELNIHRNTLTYRLNRIADLFDVDFGDEYLLTQLFLSCEILRFQIKQTDPRRQTVL